jgi:hypothetical protein
MQPTRLGNINQAPRRYGKYEEEQYERARWEAGVPLEERCIDPEPNEDPVPGDAFLQFHISNLDPETFPRVWIRRTGAEDVIVAESNGHSATRDNSLSPDEEFHRITSLGGDSAYGAADVRMAILGVRLDLSDLADPEKILDFDTEYLPLL